MQEPENMQPTSPSQREAMEEAVSQYQQDLHASPAGVQFLADRGISRETADMFRLGVVSNAHPGHDRHRGRLVIPYLHYEGYPLSVRFRCIEQHNHGDFGHGKYMSLPDEPVRMFNSRVIPSAGDEIHVTEGEFDTKILSQLGYSAVAVPGANLWQPRHRVLLAGFSRVWVWGDPDDAGADFVNTVTRALRQARGVPLRAGDVNETFLAGGEEAIHEALANIREKY